MAQTLLSRCRCGTDMEPINEGSPFSFRPNCDRTQTSEHMRNGELKRTPADRRYHLAWEQLKRQLYTPRATWPDGGRII